MRWHGNWMTDWLTNKPIPDLLLYCLLLYSQRDDDKKGEYLCEVCGVSNLIWGTELFEGGLLHDHHVIPRLIYFQFHLTNKSTKQKRIYLLVQRVLVNTIRSEVGNVVQKSALFTPSCLNVNYISICLNSPATLDQIHSLFLWNKFAISQYLHLFLFKLSPISYQHTNAQSKWRHSRNRLLIWINRI